MMLAKHKTRLTMAAILIGIGCGVNTGNPSGRGSPGGPGKPTTGTTMLLNIKELSLGRLQIAVKSAELVPVGEKIDSDKVIKILYDIKDKFETGSKSTLALDTVIPPGQYDRLKLVLTDANPLTFFDVDNKKQDLKYDFTDLLGQLNGSGTLASQLPNISGQFPGGNVLVPNGTGTQNLQIPGDLANQFQGGTLQLPNGAGTGSINDILAGLNGSGTAVSITNSSGSSGITVQTGAGNGTTTIAMPTGPVVMTFTFSAKILEFLLNEGRLVDLTADLNNNVEKRLSGPAGGNQVVEYYFKPTISMLETKVSQQAKAAPVPLR